MALGRRSKPRVDPETGELRDPQKASTRDPQKASTRKESDLVARLKDAARDAVVRATSTKP